MRSLERTEKGAERARGILSAARRAIRTYDLVPADVRVATGEEEANWAWLAANYAEDRLRPGAASVGILELGGESAQVAFEGEALGGAPELRLVRRSALGCGMTAAFEDLAESGLPDECDLEHPDGGFDACLAEVEEAFKPGGGDGCSTDDLWAESPTGDFLALAGYYHVANNLTEHTGEWSPQWVADARFQLSLADLRNKGTEYCSIDWSVIEDRLAEDEDDGRDAMEHLRETCWRAAYVYKLLEEQGFDDDFDFTFADRYALREGEDAAAFDVSWTLGAVVAENSHLGFREVG